MKHLGKGDNVLIIHLGLFETLSPREISKQSAPTVNQQVGPMPLAFGRHYRSLWGREIAGNPRWASKTVPSVVIANPALFRLGSPA
jgi:hypothetical protein